MIIENKVATIIGSTPSKDLFENCAENLADRGYLVFLPYIYGNSADSYYLTMSIIDMLIDTTRKQIDMSDVVIVVGEYGYIGTTTKHLIEYAESNNKKVFYHYQ